MARPSLFLINAMRRAAKRLDASSSYQWGHMGSCNCGFLAQEIARLDKDQIHERAMQRYGDWNDQLNDYCPTSGLPMDDLISELLKVGVTVDDLKRLERLSDTSILQHLRGGKRDLEKNRKSDVVEYLRAWADMLEEEMLEDLNLPEIAVKPSQLVV